MAKTESTAIKQLIALVHSAPIRISEPLGDTHPIAPIPPLVRDSDPTLYIEKPLSNMPSDRPIGVPARAVGTPVPAPLPGPPAQPAIPMTPRTRNALAAADVIREIRRQTARPAAPPRVHFDSRTLVKILGMMVVAVIVGALFGRLFARSSTSAKAPNTPAPAVAAAPTPAPTPSAPVVTVIETPKAPPPHVITVDFMSQPPGANVTLVSNGASVFVGTTPVMAQVDASLTHDVVFTLDGHTTKLARLTPSTTHHVSVVLDALPSKEHVAARRSHRTAKPAAPDDDKVIVSDE